MPLLQIPLGEEGAPCESASRAGREIRRASDASVMVTREVLPGNGGTGVACVVARSNDVSREIFLVLSELVDSDKFATLVLSAGRWLRSERSQRSWNRSRNPRTL